jgi:hypothetical protein
MSCELLLSQESLTPVVNVPAWDNSLPYASKGDPVTSYLSLSDTMLLELRYAYNFQSGIPSKDILENFFISLVPL